VTGPSAPGSESRGSESHGSESHGSESHGSESHGSESHAEPRKSRESDWERKKRLAEVFGDVLPESTRDDRNPDGPDRREGVGDRWLRDQVPPHHGS
jgi:hypothetical protein